MPIKIEQEESPITEIIAQCDVDPPRACDELRISDWSETAIYIEATENGVDEEDAACVSVVLEFDNAEAFFNAGLKYVAQQRKRAQSGQED